MIEIDIGKWGFTKRFILCIMYVKRTKKRDEQGGRPSVWQTVGIHVKIYVGFNYGAFKLELGCCSLHL